PGFCLDSIQPLERAVDVGKRLAGWSIKARTGTREVQRESGGEFPNANQLPAAQQCACESGVHKPLAFAEGKLPCEALVKNVRLVEIRRSPVTALIDIIEQAVRVSRVIRQVAKRPAPGIRGRDAKIVGEPVIELHLQRVISGAVAGKELIRGSGAAECTIRGLA